MGWRPPKFNRGLKEIRRKWLEERYKRDPRCHYCRNVTELPPYGYRKTNAMLEATLDHAVPVARGGWDHHRNYRLCCYTCNQLKGTMDEQSYIAELEKAGVREPIKRGRR